MNTTAKKRESQNDFSPKQSQLVQPLPYNKEEDVVDKKAVDKLLEIFDEDDIAVLPKQKNQDPNTKLLRAETLVKREKEILEDMISISNVSKPDDTNMDKASYGKGVDYAIDQWDENNDDEDFYDLLNQNKGGVKIAKAAKDGPPNLLRVDYNNN